MSDDDTLFTIADGRYAILRPLGSGGFATVYLAMDRQLGVERAVKLARVNPKAVIAARRFLDEARAMARVAHPAVLPVLDAGVDGQWHYVVTAVAAGSLADRCRDEGPLAPRAAIALLLPILDALRAAHAEGIVHRDVKPENILLMPDGRPALSDFGTARLADRDEQLTRTGVALGTLAYMPPEQRLDAHRVGPEADVYAAGATLYYVISGDSPMDLFTAGPSSPRWDNIPAPLRPILAAACAGRPERRTPTPVALADALRTVAPELSDERRPPPAAPPVVAAATLSAGAEPPARRVPVIGLVAAAALGAAVTAALLAVNLLSGPGRTTPVAPDPTPADPPADGIVREAPDEAPAPIADAPPALPAPTPPAPAPAPPPAVAEAVATPAPPEPEPEGPPLWIRGAWRGAVDGAPAALTVRGPPTALSGEATIGGAGHPLRGTLTGPRDATLRIGEPTVERWTVRFDGERLAGTVERVADGSLAPVVLRRVDP
jgi:serine/threonine protein kinase